MGLNISYGQRKATKVEDIFLLSNNVLEQAVFEISVLNQIYKFNCKFDITEITKNNFRIRTYIKIDNTNYRLYITQTYSASEFVCLIPELTTAADIKITVQSASLEGASRSVPYKYSLERI